MWGVLLVVIGCVLLATYASVRVFTHRRSRGCDCGFICGIGICISLIAIPCIVLGVLLILENKGFGVLSLMPERAVETNRTQVKTQPTSKVYEDVNSNSTAYPANSSALYHDSAPSQATMLKPQTWQVRDLSPIILKGFLNGIFFKEPVNKTIVASSDVSAQAPNPDSDAFRIRPWWISTWFSFIAAGTVGIIGIVVAVGLKGVYQHTLVVLAIFSCSDLVFDFVTGLEMIWAGEKSLAAASFGVLLVFFILDLIFLLHTEITIFNNGFVLIVKDIWRKIVKYFPQMLGGGQAENGEDGTLYSAFGQMALAATMLVRVFHVVMWRLMSYIVTAKLLPLTTILLPLCVIIMVVSLVLSVVFFFVMSFVMILESDTAAECMVGRMPKDEDTRRRVLIVFEGLRCMQDLLEMIIEILYGLKAGFSTTTAISLALGGWQMLGRALAVGFHIARDEIDVIVGDGDIESPESPQSNLETGELPDDSFNTPNTNEGSSGSDNISWIHRLRSAFLQFISWKKIIPFEQCKDGDGDTKQCGQDHLAHNEDRDESMKAIDIKSVDQTSNRTVSTDDNKKQDEPQILMNSPTTNALRQRNTPQSSPIQSLRSKFGSLRNDQQCKC